jgi:hypothetical protein
LSNSAGVRFPIDISHTEMVSVFNFFSNGRFNRFESHAVAGSVVVLVISLEDLIWAWHEGR